VIVQRLLSIDPYWWPIIGAALAALGLLARRACHRAVDWGLEILEPSTIAAMTVLAIGIEAFGEPYGWGMAAMMPMVFATAFSFTAVVFRLGLARLVPDFEGPVQKRHVPSIICSLTAFGLTLGTFLDTLLLYDYPKDRAGLHQSIYVVASLACIIGLVSIVVIVIDMIAHVRQSRSPSYVL
jgi:hypothetical protein